MSNFKTLSIIFIAVFCLSACNTIQGVGKDIGAAGEAIEGSAKKNKKY